MPLFLVMLQQLRKKPPSQRSLKMRGKGKDIALIELPRIIKRFIQGAGRKQMAAVVRGVFFLFQKGSKQARRRAHFLFGRSHQSDEGVFSEHDGLSFFFVLFAQKAVLMWKGPMKSREIELRWPCFFWSCSLCDCPFPSTRLSVCLSTTKPYTVTATYRIFIVQQYLSVCSWYSETWKCTFC